MKEGSHAETTRVDTRVVRSGKGGQGRGMRRLRFGPTGSNIRSTWGVSGYFPLEFIPRREGGCFPPRNYVDTALWATRNKEERTHRPGIVDRSPLRSLAGPREQFQCNNSQYFIPATYAFD